MAKTLTQQIADLKDVIERQKKTIEVKDDYISLAERDKEKVMFELLQTNWELEDMKRDVEDMEHELIKLRNDVHFKNGVIDGFKLAILFMAWQNEE
jgi:chromosome segregation ATPase